ncbi:hypothetical protein K2Z83_24375 [Oscillochloris sp. ZM17-4]|uniref:hypothetical protein n=1 Tax=Oscillochloris sp. ZM17-4 TaxID=2866714 RepID=UPI001C7354CA|nr:hypothetical protein [Oscillochloris sp. ZM17-4]MBX0330798.1 hypothetical protein [Oscillochloris sp. ZM17-4]
MSTNPYLGINVNLASADELRKRGILEEDEPLLALFDGVLLDESRRRIGGVAICDFVALTDQRLVMWARGFFNDTVDSFLWQDVDVAKADSWDPWHGRVTFAFRLAAVAPRTRRIAFKGTLEDPGSGERVVINTLDYMPADDVGPLSSMIAWTGDQVIAGVTGEALVKAFAEQFPAPERAALSPFFAAMMPEPAAPPPPPPPAPNPVDQPRRRWWQRKSNEADNAGMPSTGNLIADYESRRSGQPAGDGTPALPMAGPMSSMAAGSTPMMPEQPSMYEVSRSLRLVLEAPRRLVRGARRAGEMMNGAGDLMSGMQNPLVRRNAMRGIYQAAAQQEAENGPLASVGPIVRAAVRFTEPLESEEAQAQAQAQAASRRRVQVRATARLTPSSQSTGVEPVSTPGSQPVAPEATGPVRRSINVRRVVPPADVPAPEAAAPEASAVPEAAAPEAAAPEAPAVRRSAASRVPVRRLAITPNGQEPAPRAVPAGVDEEE